MVKRETSLHFTCAHIFIYMHNQIAIFYTFPFSPSLFFLKENPKLWCISFKFNCMSWVLAVFWCYFIWWFGSSSSSNARLWHFCFVTFKASAVAQRDSITDSSELNVVITNFVESLKVTGYFCDSTPHRQPNCARSNSQIACKSLSLLAPPRIRRRWLLLTPFKTSGNEFVWELWKYFEHLKWAVE